jgi:FdhD protein
MKGVERRRSLHVSAEGSDERDDQVAVEEPLEIRIAGDALAVTMRTPGHDHELVAGFLLAEGLLHTRDDLGGVAHCGRPGDEGYGNVIDVTAPPGSVLNEDKARSRRGTLTTSACGVCGRTTIADLVTRLAPPQPSARFERTLLLSLSERLREKQPNFARTGGVHAAAVVRADGELWITREDVGRHNAVDKAIGRALLDGALPLATELLLVSGRPSFEIVQKAAAAGLPAVVGVSAPSSLSIATAEALGMLLVGFARSGSYNVYAGAGRLF